MTPISLWTKCSAQARWNLSEPSLFRSLSLQTLFLIWFHLCIICLVEQLWISLKGSLACRTAAHRLQVTSVSSSWRANMRPPTCLQFFTRGRSCFSRWSVVACLATTRRWYTMPSSSKLWREQWAVSSEQWAVSSEQWAVSSEQWAVSSEQMERTELNQKKKGRERRSEGELWGSDYWVFFLSSLLCRAHKKWANHPASTLETVSVVLYSSADFLASVPTELKKSGVLFRCVTLWPSQHSKKMLSCILFPSSLL